MQNEPKILTFDCETFPIEAYTWGIFEATIGLDMIIQDWTLASFAAKWLGKPEIIYSDTSNKRNPRDDKAVVKKLASLLDEADAVITQNGNSFDLKKLNARMVQHELPPYSPVRSIDTLRVARKHFAFTSNKLAWTSKLLTDTPKSEHKKFPGMELWLGCLSGNKEAWAEMKKYNIQDVVATEQLYLKQRPWITSHPNVTAYSATTANCCPKCSSPKMQARGFSMTQSGKYQRFQCQACGGWSRDKQALLTQDKRKSLLVSQ